MTDIVERLWASDAASALTNEAARAIEQRDAAILRLRAERDGARREALEEAVSVCQLVVHDCQKQKDWIAANGAQGCINDLHKAMNAPDAIRALPRGESEGGRTDDADPGAAHEPDEGMIPW